VGAALYLFLFRNSREVARPDTEKVSLWTQSQGAQDAIRIVTGLGPAVFVALGALLMLAYPLTEQRFETIVSELADQDRAKALAAELPAADDRSASN
jgi:Na+/melibiose symporter-like transporter